MWGERPGHFHFAFGVGGFFNEAGKYEHEHWLPRHGRWPDDRDRFLEEALAKSGECDVYAAPYLRTNASRKKGSALPSSVLYADVDEAPNGPPKAPGGVLLLGPGGLLVASGRGLHPYLRLPKELEAAELEQLNRHLAYALGADSGWAENKVLRLPGTWNHKPRAKGGRSLPVELIEYRPALRDWSAEELRGLLGPPPAAASNGAAAPAPKMPEQVPAHLLARLEEQAEDRSKASYSFVAACLDAELADAEVLAVALLHRPAQEKWPADDLRAAEIERAIRKLRESRATSPIDLAATSPPGDLATSPLPLQRGEVESSPIDLAADLAAAPTQEPHSWLPVSLVAKGANPPAPPEIIGLLYPGYNHLVSGESEALKTWLALAAAAAEIAAGRGVLWVDADDVGEGALLERLRLLGVEDEAIDRRFAYVLPDEPLDESRRAEVLGVVRSRSCRLAVLDGFNPLLFLHGMDPDKGTDVERFYRLIDPIRKAPTAVYLADNVVKAREARGKWAIGSERKKSKAEVHLGMRGLVPLIRGGTGRAKIDVHKDRPGHLQRPSPGVLVIESSCSWEIRPDESRGAEGVFRPTALMEKVCRYLEGEGEACSRNQIEQQKLGGTEYVRLAIDRLISEGYATEFEGPRNARLVRLERRFRADEGEAA